MQLSLIWNSKVRKGIAGLIFFLANMVPMGCQQDVQNPNEVTMVKVVTNPSGHVPLAAEIVLQSGLSDITVLVSDGEREWEVPQNIIALGGNIPVVGMKPDKDHTIKVDYSDSQGRKQSSVLTHKTPKLPESLLEFPPINVVKSEPELMEPGLTFLSIRRRALGRGHWLTPAQLKFSMGWGVLVALNAKGEVVWYYNSDSRVAGIKRLKNGNLMMHRADFSTREIDLVGNLVGEYYAEKRPKGKSDNPNAIPILGQQTLHHQPHEMPDGSFLAFSANAHNIPNYPTSELDPEAPRKTQKVMADDIVIFDKSGNQVWNWRSMDYLDPYRIGYDTFWSYWWTRGFDQHVDWTHGNGLSYYPEKRAVLASFRNQCAVVSIDLDTKNINWILGKHDNWPEHLRDKLLKPIGDQFMWPCYQHNPRYTSQGTVIMFDNRATGAKMPFEPRPKNYSENFSRAVEYKIDDESMTIEQIWTTGDEQGEDPCYSFAMSDAWRLPETDNRLVIYAFCAVLDDTLTEDIMDETKRSGDDLPYGGRVVEYAGEQEVFRAEVKDPNEIIQWEVYGGFKSSSIYKP